MVSGEMSAQTAYLAEGSLFEFGLLKLAGMVRAWVHPAETHGVLSTVSMSQDEQIKGGRGRPCHLQISSGPGPVCRKRRGPQRLGWMEGAWLGGC